MRRSGRATSDNVQKVVFFLDEMQADCRRVDHGWPFGNTATDAYIAMDPTAKVPAPVDAEVVVRDSGSILRCLTEKADSPPCSADLVARSRIDRWTDWLLATLNGSRVTIFKATRGGEPVRGAVARKFATALAILDRQLAGSPCLAGDALAVADVAMAPIAHRRPGFPVEPPPLEALRARHRRLSECPALRAVVQS